MSYFSPLFRPKRSRVILPTLHAGQETAYFGASRFTALRCGRRWGKTQMIVALGGEGATRGENIGIFAPDYKILNETWRDLHAALTPVLTASSETKGVMTTSKGGRIDFWTLENERAGRSRKYHKVFIDEAAFTKDNMMKIWETAIRPTLTDYRGEAWAMSTPNGVNPDNFFYKICTDPKYRFTEYHAPTHTNPYMPPEELLEIEQTSQPMVYRQETLAEFVDWAGTQFFSLAHCMGPAGTNGEPQGVEFPTKCDAVFAIVDTAVKTGKEHDGTAVTFWGINKFHGHPLILLDWDIVQIEGSLLEVWLPTVFQNLEHLAKRTQARAGSIGAHIEDKVSGTILIQQAQRRNMDANAIDSALTSMGKDERAISVSGYVYQGKVKITQEAYQKVTTYKGNTRNHLIAQVFGFKLGMADGKQMDDLLDCFTYGIALALGNYAGF